MSEKKSRSIFQVLLVPLLSVLMVQIALMIGTFLISGVFGRLDQNMQDILQKQVQNRRDYLLNEMIGNWSELDMLAGEINTSVEEMIADGQINMDDLCCESKQYIRVLNAIVPELIDTMYNKQVSGIFVVLNTHNQDEVEMLPGVYLRDLDPKATPSTKREDILVQRAPRDVVQAGVLPTDVNWQPMFSAADSIEKAYFSKPYYEACSTEPGKRLHADAYGYWSCDTYSLSGDNQSAISYSIPLMLEDGTVYGVLGVELLTSYIQSLLPESELHQDGHGAYMLAVAKEGRSVLKPVVMSGTSITQEQVIQYPFTLVAGATIAEEKSDTYYAAVEPLVIYSRNAPFEGDKWYLLGSVPEKELFKFSSQLKWSFVFSAIATLMAGLLGVLLVSYRISKPVKKVSKEVKGTQNLKKIPVLSRINISEIDDLVNAVMILGKEILESSTRFLNIINMASVELAGYEIRNDSDNVYVTDNYFKLLEIEDVDIENLTTQRFKELQEMIGETLEYTVAEDGSILYEVPLKAGGVRYLRAEERQLAHRQIGLMEDVTSSVMETKKIEKDRDYDLLTGLLNRQGFKREAERVFQNPELLKTAAVLMMDLDNLKIINDTFGHSVGDLYIQKASACFYHNVPEKTLVARISGDEFILLFYGYDDNVEIWNHVTHLYHEIRNMEFVLPDGENKGVSASGGLAWYPKDSDNLSELMKLSDFAMYCVKKREKGNVGDFDIVAYEEMLHRNQMQQEFYHLLEYRELNYHFQPIFDGKTGKPYAYEALMRVNMPNLRSPLDVLQIARESDRMREIETITMFNASEAYETLLKEQKVASEALLFVNSIADVSMTVEDDMRYHERFEHLQKNLVVEITEGENLDMELLKKKKSVEGFSGMLALDDYGSGYNTELNLLEINPNFIKVDIAIVRNIHLDENKQQIVKNIVEYAHKRGMMIIAEGLEYPEEVEKSLELGVDLLQGYFLAKPGAVPPEISDAAKTLIQEYWKK